MVDLWHLADTPEIERHLTENVGRITGVHVAEWFAEPRDDRALPGERCARADARPPTTPGWRGAWDVEIFGDPERPDSLWALDVDEAATACLRGGQLLHRLNPPLDLRERLGPDARIGEVDPELGELLGG